MLPGQTSLQELAGLFLRLGVLGFGGPAAHIALMEAEVVRKRGWLTHEEFMDLLGMTNLIPGPNSTELAIHIGRTRAGWPGLWVAGLCFILPAFFLVTLLGWGYVTYGALPEFGGILYGIKPVMLAIIFQALWGLGQKALKTRFLTLLALAAALLNVGGVNELEILLGAVLLVAFLHRWVRGLLLWNIFPGLMLFQSPVPARLTQPGAEAVPFTLEALFWFFLKVGSVLFGSGYVLLAFLQGQLVERWGWLTQAQLLDAVVVGQVTPGPVFTTATFVGFLLGGWPGAVVATVGIFLPAFVFVSLTGPLVPKIRQNALAGALLDGVNAASLALMLVVTIRLTGAALVDPLTVLLGLASAVLLLRYQWNALLLVLLGGLVGLLAHGLP